MDGDWEDTGEGNILADGHRLPFMTRIRIRFRVEVPTGKRPEAERAFQLWHNGCGMYQTLRNAVDITWTWEIQEVD